MRESALYLWQLPQHLVGLLMIAVFKCREISYIATPEYYRTARDYKGIGGVSLGEYRIFFRTPDRNAIMHEMGHTEQSRRLGLLYLFVIGLPSFLGNIAHRFVKFDYYAQPWEKWADALGGVTR